MLYVTTRNNRDVYTAARVLKRNRGEDGGLYVPFRLPKLSEEEVRQLICRSFQDSVAGMVNLLFGTRISAWEVSCCMGRHPVRLRNLGRKTHVAELWHNPRETQDFLISSMAALLRKDEMPAENGSWLDTGIRMAVLCGVFSLLAADGTLTDGEKADISVVSGDFSGVMSAWYARQLGLPIGNIICSCNENSTLWEFIHHGQLKTDRLAVATNTPEGDAVLPVGLERLIFACGGAEEVARYLDASRRGGVYCPGEGMLETLRKSLCVSVVGQSRVQQTIPSVFSTHRYVLSPYGALAYAGLLDSRVITGQRRQGLVIVEKSPLCDADVTAAALGTAPEELKEYC